MTTENPTVAANAVTQNVLPMHELTLIGLFYANNTPSALIRTSRGAITKVKTGDIVGNKTVAAISEDALILAAGNGAQTVLQMPS
ncbi:hypothetical protein SAMN04488515_1406 [Cognatiyoonia koreensis]|uniref:Uncharacterized protein n=1 Tax=Cognatiyoonia koreensis TaxID=364200 RepID=A0A1I0PT17_9RHOB|nr:hypothetical protein [Cognatiyoonia koreensis]SEW17519.1 hypothetical protein SAMN04488515_1406 [Cognatiyoonia koreensis]